LIAFDIGIIPRIYKEYLQLHNETNNPFLHGQTFGKQLRGEPVWVTNKSSFPIPQPVAPEPLPK
jgi:hypothetical protein